MVIEISTRVLRTKDVLKTRGVTVVYNAPYVPISQHGYGRMDASTPAHGLATSSVASCLAVVFHSPTTGRTVLTHSPNFLRMNTFVPIIDWVTGGKGEVSDNDMLAWFQDAGAEPCEMQAVVLRGYLYATSLANRFGHDGWMDDFRQFLSTPRRAIRLNIMDAPRFLTSGAVLVDKTTAHITYIEVDKNMRPRATRVLIRNPNIPESESYSEAQVAQDLFVGMLLSTKIPEEPCPISLQYDIARYCLPLPLTDEGRQLVRSKREGEPAVRQSDIIRAFGASEDSDWISRPKGYAIVNLVFTNLATEFGPPCERCGRAGSQTCGGCKGAWYCGKVHQREDWKAHKGWCKGHPFSK